MPSLLPTVSRWLAVSLILVVCAVRPLGAQETSPPKRTPFDSPSPMASASPAAPDGPRDETIVFIRHGEKPANDEGQLTCQGLNRALALSDVLIARYGAAQFVFAPTTTKKPASKGTGAATGVMYSYVRPLMTIEPTAIRLGLPVETKFAYDEIAGLQSELTSPPYQRAVIYVAWEHTLLDELVKRLMTTFGSDADEVPKWPKDDYDSIFVVRIHTEGGKRTVKFAHEQEALDGLSTDCPEARRR